MYTHGMAILEIIWCFINLGNEGFGETCFQVKLLGSSQCFFFWPEKIFFFIFKKKKQDCEKYRQSGTQKEALSL